MSNKTGDLKGALKLKPAARYLGGLSVPTMHRLVERGLLRPNRSLRHLLFPIEELDRFLKSGQTDSGG
jgi:Helix-turn-helix domain